MTSSTERPESGAAEIPAGRVGRPHGLDGGFYVTGARPRLLEVGASVGVGGMHMEIARRAGTDEHPILHLEGVADRDAAVALRGLEMTVSSDRAPELDEGEFWAHELEGCRVIDGEREVGTVARLIELPSCEALEVERGGGTPLLVPMVHDAIRELDVERRVVDVDLDFLGEPE